MPDNDAPGEAYANEAETFDLVTLIEARPLSKREVNKILKASAKQEARDIWAMVNGMKEIVLVSESATREAFEVAAAPQGDNKADAELSGEVLSGPTQILGRPLSGISGQRRYRSVGGFIERASGGSSSKQLPRRNSFAAAPTVTHRLVNPGASQLSTIYSKGARRHDNSGVRGANN